MGDVMPKEQAEWIADTQKYCLEATNMTEQEAYNFAFRCWQLGFAKKKHIAKDILAEIEIKAQQALPKRPVEMGGRALGNSFELGKEKALLAILAIISDLEKKYIQTERE